MGIKIALTGKMRSGKDTVADYLKREYGFKTFAFAEGIKFVCGSLHLEPSNGRKPRALYQGVGQDLRKYDPDVWLKYTFDKIRQKCGPDDNIVVSDVRQPNEVDALRAVGFTIICVDSSEENRMARMLALGDDFKTEDLRHKTELAVDTLDVDFSIKNNGTLPDLYYTVTQIMFTMFDLYEPTLWDDEGDFKWANF